MTATGFAAPTRPETALAFSPGEYERRLRLVRGAMAERGIDTLVVDQLDHVVWLFGYLPTAARYQSVILPIDEEPHAFVRELDLPAFLEQSWVRSYETYSDDEDEFPRSIKAVLARTKGKVGFEFDSNIFTAQRYAAAMNELAGAEIVDASGLLWELRVIKSEEEINALRRAAEIADLTLQAAIPAVQVGGFERDPAVAAYTAALLAGADNGRVATFGYGATVESMHGRLGTRQLESGQLYFIETVPQVKGYSSRIVRPVSLGRASSEQRRVAERLVAIQDAQIAAMEVGAVAGDVDAICREALLREGLKQRFPQVTGYTVGLHAVPRTADHTRIFVPGQEWTLQENMVFHVIVYTQGLPFSETVQITSDGPVRLTTTERRLFENE
ncbi:peptidase M24 (plasmid) [Arthrobacter sp. StoSoilB3]|nr:peptidase M24 [Arthrobacter sp. StoSoilB3]